MVSSIAHLSMNKGVAGLRTPTIENIYIMCYLQTYICNLVQATPEFLILRVKPSEY